MTEPNRYIFLATPPLNTRLLELFNAPSHIRQSNEAAVIRMHAPGRHLSSRLAPALPYEVEIHVRPESLSRQRLTGARCGCIIAADASESIWRAALEAIERATRYAESIAVVVVGAQTISGNSSRLAAPRIVPVVSRDALDASALDALWELLETPGLEQQVDSTFDLDGTANTASGENWADSTGASFAPEQVSPPAASRADLAATRTYKTGVHFPAATAFPSGVERRSSSQSWRDSTHVGPDSAAPPAPPAAASSDSEEELESDFLDAGPEVDAIDLELELPEAMEDGEFESTAIESVTTSSPGPPSRIELLEEAEVFLRYGLREQANEKLGEALREPLLETDADAGAEFERSPDRASPAPAKPIAREAEERLVSHHSGWLQVPVFFGTDRKPIDNLEAPYFHGRGEKLALGVLEVSIPSAHRKGRLEAPRWWKLETKERPDRHVMIVSLERLDQGSFVRSMRATAEKSSEPAALVFVHGYNVDFVSAARRAAQLAHDLEFPGVAALYSWASEGAAERYTFDETNVGCCTPYLTRFIQLLCTEAGLERVHLIAHSMGNRALLEALQLLRQDAATGSRIREVIFAAPDVDAQRFRNDSRILPRRSQRYTLYASSNDLALRASKMFHGYPRAGDSGAGVVIVPGLDTIDASAVDTSLLGHTYIGNNRSILADVHAILRLGQSPNQRFGLKPTQAADGLFWALVP